MREEFRSRDGGVMRYRSKDALLSDIRQAHDSLVARLEAVPAGRWRDRGVWGDAWTITDLVAHLSAWQRMFLDWHTQGLAGGLPAMPARGYKWNETPALNRTIQAKHRRLSPATAMVDFDAGYLQICRLAHRLSADQLLLPGQFAWTGKNSLTTYLAANTASHYRFAVRMLDRWQKARATPSPARHPSRLSSL
jgi:hypothetical protein